MQDCCYTIAIRQRRCENDIPRQIDNIYTNTTIDTVFPLSFGYTVTYVSCTEKFITIKLSNPNFIPDITFNIPSGSYRLFDLPIETGTLRVYIGAIRTCCPASPVCCNNELNF